MATKIMITFFFTLYTSLPNCNLHYYLFLFFIHNINFPSKNFANLTVLPKNVAKVIHLCQIDTFRIAHNSF